MIELNDIIFEDGLSREKIEQNIDNLGQFQWVLKLECRKLRVGLTSKKDDIILKSGLILGGEILGGIIE